MREAHRSFRATGQQRSKINPKACSKPLGAPLTLGQFTGTVLERPRGGSGTLLDGSWPLLAVWGAPKSALGRHLGVQKLSRARPDAFPKQTVLGAKKNRFFVDFGSISDGFLSIFERFVVDFR